MCVKFQHATFIQVPRYVKDFLIIGHAKIETVSCENAVAIVVISWNLKSAVVYIIH